MKVRPPTLMGVTLRRLRGERTLQQIEAMTGNRVTASSIFRLETGEYKTASSETLEALAEALGAHPDTFKTLASPIPAFPSPEFVDNFVKSLPEDFQAKLRLRLEIFEPTIAQLKRQLENVTQTSERLAALSQLANTLDQYAEQLEKEGRNAAEARKESASYLQQALQEAKSFHSAPAGNEGLRATISQLKRDLEKITIPHEHLAALSHLANLLDLYAQSLEQAGKKSETVHAESEYFLQQALNAAERFHSAPAPEIASQFAAMKEQLKSLSIPVERLAALSQLANTLDQYAEQLEKEGRNAAEARKESASYLQQALEEASRIRKTFDAESKNLPDR